MARKQMRHVLSWHVSLPLCMRSASRCGTRAFMRSQRQSRKADEACLFALAPAACGWHHNMEQEHLCNRKSQCARACVR
eukprot:scaffold74621_cov25-Tisochrysis_lutea.AAC.2